MKKRLAVLLLLVPVLLVLGGTSSAGAGAARKVTGGIQWSLPGSRAWAEVNVHEVAPGQAKGSVNSEEHDEVLGWRRWKAHPICVAFDKGFDGEPASTFVASEQTN